LDHRISPRHLLALAAQREGGRTAVMASGARLTYRELSCRCTSLAARLQQIGVGPGVQVAMALPNSLAFLVWYFGVLEAGGIVVPWPADLPGTEIAARLAFAEIPFLVAPEQATWLDLKPQPDLDAVEGSRLWQRDGSIRGLVTAPGSQAGIMLRHHSSGSTGRPKEMFKTEGNIAQECQHFSRTLGLGRDDVFLGVAPFCHAFGAISFLAAFAAGGSLIVLPRFLPGAVLEVARRGSPTLFLATPPMIQLLGNCRLEPGDEGAFRALRFCICSTGSLAKTAHDAFQRRFGKPVHVQYGSTETLSATVDLDEDFEEGRVGRPYDGVEVGIFDGEGSPCPFGQRGLVGIRSPAASQGYLDDPVSTAKIFRDGFVFPGDVGHLDAQGRLHLLGRFDIINIGGYKVDCLEVEEVILRALPVRAVIVTAGERAGLPVVRAVLEADPGQVTRAMVREACRSSLSSYKVPELVEVLSELPRDDKGKIQRVLI